ncbi:hypothetical protein N7492_002257 [Penicillium capsulatum]|uniref:PPM-type phosphatase domain-containing protein n=1 Tax=Penicillium capsulatum TaxID=69766 RepID=A0A9W9LW67_9EURO|nr:hypothetical protein N7492_002257 [Penicillium capsulatum]KAJ6123139.1 hypothetical protein N7512_005604 [Penicillium capsulatum]
MFQKTAMSTSDAIVAQGGRESQEDRCTILLPEEFPSSSDKHRLAFFAVYDGHGSELVSEHASQTLHHLLAKRPEFERGEYALAIKGALKDEDSLLLERFKYESAEPAISGSTVAVGFVNLTTGELIVSNLGDSHVILAERDPRTEHPYHIRRLTEAHKPEAPRERQRIEDAGGTVVMRGGIPRLGSLNMSRALGDLQYKQPVNESNSARARPTGDFVSNDPFISRRTLRRDRRYLLVIASDGVTDRIDDTALVQHVMKQAMRGHGAREMAQSLASSSASHAHSDNASCIVVLLDGQGS